jgi:hypothetical protein
MSLVTEQLTLSGPVEAATVDICPAAFEARRVALAAAKVCREIRDHAAVKEASSAYVAVKALIKQVEDSRNLIKAPVLAAGRAIDQTCKTFVEDLELEGKRLNTLIGNYQSAEQQKANAARLESERQERLIRDEQEQRERDRLAAARAGETGNLEGDMDAIAAEADQAALEVRQQAVAVAESTAAPVGIQVRKNWKFEITDIKRLFAAFPDLCTIEPNNAAIRAIIKHRQDLPGVRVWAENAALVTAKAVSAVPTKVEDYDY